MRPTPQHTQEENKEHILQTPRYRVGIMGASGYTGTELVQILQHHPAIQIAFATSRSYAGQSLRAVEPSAPNLMLQPPDSVSVKDVDVVFVCLPHGTTAAITKECLEAGARVVDLSGDLRLRSEKLHQKVYGTPRSKGLSQQAVYGLTEFQRHLLPGANLVSNPGCYPTCSMLGLAPLAREGLLEGDVVIQAVSGISGAGRKARPNTHFCMATENVRPYKPGRLHRHVPEMEQTLHILSPEGTELPQVIFNPHTVPVERGMLATMVVQVPKMSYPQVRELFLQTYQSEPFVEVLPEGEAAEIRTVTRTNRVAIGLHSVAGSDRIVVTCAIDNLQKGAAGQAVQNMNLMLGLEETTGLIGAPPALIGWQDNAQ